MTTRAPAVLKIKDVLKSNSWLYILSLDMSTLETALGWILPCCSIPNKAWRDCCCCPHTLRICQSRAHISRLIHLDILSQVCDRIYSSLVANEESRGSLQGLSPVTALGLGSQAPRLNICFTWFYAHHYHQATLAPDLQMECCVFVIVFFCLCRCIFFTFCVWHVWFVSKVTQSTRADLTNCSCCLTYLTMYLINRRCSCRLLWVRPGAAWQ